MTSTSSPPPPPTAPSSSDSDERLVNRWRKTFGLITGVGLSEAERSIELEKHHTRTCEDWKKQLIAHSPSVVFMLKHLGLNGANVTPENIRCTPCDMTRAGGFSPDAGSIVLCQGRFFSKGHMEDTIVHELVHMYDHTKFKVNWNDLRHHACSEIRANSLSGDCRLTREWRRGVFSFSKQHQECVRRRAILSVQANPACPDTATAERAVNEVWESCFSDTRPFDEIY